MDMTRRRWLLVVPVFVLLGGAAIGLLPSRRPLLQALGSMLVVDEPVSPSDVIVVPAWAGDAGVLEAAGLVHDGSAPQVAIVPGPDTPAGREFRRRGIPYKDDAAEMASLLSALGVEKVMRTPDAAAGTEAESLMLPAWCDEHGFRAVIVVSAPDHARRIRRVIRRDMRGRQIRVAVRSARYSSFDPENWWHSREGVRTEIIELQKLLLDVARHPFS